MSRSSVVIAAGIALAAAGWIASGMIGRTDNSAAMRPDVEMRAPLVQVSALRAREITRFVTAQGDVTPFRLAEARTQSAGRVAEILVSNGDSVAEGQPVLRLTLEGLDSRLREAEAILARRERDFEVQEELRRRGNATEAQLRELRTSLESAREEVRRIEEQIDHTTIRAPFAGRIDDLMVEPGVYVDAGSPVVLVVENVPLVTQVRISQADRTDIGPDRPVHVAYATGQEEVGVLCFISSAADPQTRTFRAEVRTPNAQATVPSGISAEVRIPIDAVPAHFVSPATLSLGTDGTLGLKTVEGENEVAFHPVGLVRADTGGLWVSGLPDEARVITLGQGFVNAGDTVRVAEADEGAATTPSPAPDVLQGIAAPDLCGITAPAATESAARPEAAE